MNQAENVVDLAEHFKGEQEKNKARQEMEELLKRKERFSGWLSLIFGKISEALDKGEGITITITPNPDPEHFVVRTAKADEHSKE